MTNVAQGNNNYPHTRNAIARGLQQDPHECCTQMTILREPSSPWNNSQWKMTACWRCSTKGQ
eukprot:317864-Amphidinium_carterae.1